MFTSKRARPAVLPTMFLALMLGSTSCSHLFYHPSDLMYLQNPEKVEKLREAVEFKSADGTKLTGWFFETSLKNKKGVVIQFHGNAENLTSHFQSVYWMVAEGYDFFSFDYRGYGISEGKPTQAGLNQDALAAIHYILNRERPFANSKPDVVLYGQSLGGAVLMRAYADVTPDEKKRVRAMVIESSFDNYHAIARDLLSRSFITWLFQPLGYVLVSNAYGPDDFIDKISPTPLLVMHGDHDKVIPLKFGERIFATAREPKQFLLVPGAGHLQCMQLEAGKYRPALLDFIK